MVLKQTEIEFDASDLIKEMTASATTTTTKKEFSYCKIEYLRPLRINGVELKDGLHNEEKPFFPSILKGMIHCYSFV